MSSHRPHKPLLALAAIAATTAMMLTTSLAASADTATAASAATGNTSTSQTTTTPSASGDAAKSADATTATSSGTSTAPSPSGNATTSGGSSAAAASVAGGTKTASAVPAPSTTASAVKAQAATTTATTSDAITTYYLHFDFSGGSCNSNDPDMNACVPTKTLDSNDYAVTPDAFSLIRDGYKLDSWNTKVDGTGVALAPGAQVNYAWAQAHGTGEDIQLYAQWTKDGASSNCTITYVDGPEDLNPNGEFNWSNTSSCPYATTITTNTAQADTGYAFTGWNTKEDGTGTSYTAGQSITLTSNMTLYPQYRSNRSYTFTFDANGGTGTAPTSITQTSGLNVTLPKNTFTAKDGYRFRGWAFDATGSNTIYAAGDTVPMMAENTIMYAIWEAIPTDTVTFAANGGTGSIADISVKDGQKITFPKNTFTRAGFAFTGFGDDMGDNNAGKGTLYQPGDTVVVNGSVTYYAQWIQNVPAKGWMLTLNSNYGGSHDLNDTTALSSKTTPTVTLSSDTFTRRGYTLSGWNTDEDGTGEQYKIGDTYNISHDNTLYAQWTRNKVTVSFDGNGATVGTIPSITVDAITDILLPTNDFTRAGYAFLGWSTSADDGNVDDLLQPGKDICPDENVTYYAQWVLDSQKPHTITLLSNDSDNYKLTFNKAINIGENFIRDGYTLSSFNTKADGTGTTYANGTTLDDSEDITLYAQWTKDAPKGQMTLKFDVNALDGYDAPDAITVDYGMPVQFLGLKTPIRRGYTFLGWNSMLNGKGIMYGVNAGETSSISMYYNTTLFAQWQKNAAKTYTISFDINGGTGNTPPSEVHNDGETITLPSSAGFSYKGIKYIIGWNTRADGTGFLYAPSDPTYVVDHTTTLYAQWVWTIIPLDSDLAVWNETAQENDVTITEIKPKANSTVHIDIHGLSNDEKAQVDAGRQVKMFAYIYSTPTALKDESGDTAQTVKKSGSTYYIDAVIPAGYSGSHTIAVYDQNSGLAGWTKTTIAADSTTPTTPTNNGGSTTNNGGSSTSTGTGSTTNNNGTGSSTATSNRGISASNRGGVRSTAAATDELGRTGSSVVWIVVSAAVLLIAAVVIVIIRLLRRRVVGLFD